MRRTPRQAVPTTGIMPRLKFVTISPKSEAASELILDVECGRVVFCRRTQKKCSPFCIGRRERERIISSPASLNAGESVTAMFNTRALLLHFSTNTPKWNRSVLAAELALDLLDLVLAGLLGGVQGVGDLVLDPHEHRIAVPRRRPGAHRRQHARRVQLARPRESAPHHARQRQRRSCVCVCGRVGACAMRGACRACQEKPQEASVCVWAVPRAMVRPEALVAGSWMR